MNQIYPILCEMRIKFVKRPKKKIEYFHHTFEDEDHHFTLDRHMMDHHACQSRKLNRPMVMVLWISFNRLMSCAHAKCDK